MGDENEGGATFGMAGEQEIDNMLPGHIVEIAGRLVGDEDSRMWRQRARKGDALLFSAGELRRIVASPVREPNSAKLLFCAIEGVRNTGELERDGDIFKRRHRGNQVERLKDDAHMPTAETREPILIKPADIFSRDNDRPGIGPFKACHDHQQCRLTRARGADQANRLSLAYMQRDILEDMNPRRAATERKIDSGKRNRRSGRAACR